MKRALMMLTAVVLAGSGWDVRADESDAAPMPQRRKVQRATRGTARQDPALALSLANRLLEDPDPAKRVEGLKWFASAPGAPNGQDPLFVRRVVKLAKDADPRVRVAALGALGAFHVTESAPMAIEALKDREASVRLQAAQVLQESGDASAVPALRAALDDRDAQVRLAAMVAWGKFATPQDLPALTKILDHPDAGVRVQMVRALGGLGPRALPLLRQALAHPKAGVSQDAVITVNDTPALDPDAQPFYQQAAAHSDPEVRRLAVEGVAQARDPRGFPLLERALGDADPRVKTAAIRGLGESASPNALTLVAGFLQDPDPSIRLEAVQVVSDSKPFTTRPDFQAMVNDPDRLVRGAVIEALIQSSDPSAAPILLTVTAGLDVPGRQRMAARFGLWHADGLPPLFGLLADAEPKVRGQALESIHKICLELDPSPPTGLWKPSAPIGDTALQLALVRALSPLLTSERHPPTRSLAVHVLGFAGPQAFSLLAGELRHPDAGSRIAAVVALGRLKDRRALPALVQALDDPDYNVQIQVLSAMGEHGDDAIPAFQKALLHKNPQVAAEAQHWMGKLNVSSALLVLLSLLEHPDPTIRANAAHSIGQLRDLKGLPALREALNDPDPAVRQGAQKGIDAMEGLESEEFQRINK